MALPALAGGRQLHHAIIGEDAEHDLHLRVEFILRKRLEQHLFGVNVRQPRSPDGIVAIRCKPPGDWLAFEARVAQQLRNWIHAHSFVLSAGTLPRIRWRRSPDYSPRIGRSG